MWLQTRMYFLVGLMFALLYGLIVVIANSAGYGGFLVYGILAALMMFIQYMAGPKIIEFSMGIRYVSEAEAPELHQMVSELSSRAGIKKPRVAISNQSIPNAFAFGRSVSDGRVCVTSGILRALSRDELRAVLGHEISHIKNRDVAVITLLSVVPMVCWYLAWNLMFSGDRDKGNLALLGIGAFVMYFVMNLLVLYGSRIREYYADKGSVQLGNSPHHLASALYKIVYFSARAPQGAVREVSGCKAFFMNDPGRAKMEINDFAQLDSNRDGTVSMDELMQLRNKEVKISGGEKFMELWSTHPNMLKRVKHLSKLNN